MSDPIDLKCPKCGRWLCEVESFGRAKCCGWEITVRYMRADKPPPRLTASEIRA